MIYGLRPDGRLAILMSRDGLTLEQTKAMARQRGFLAAYMPDHASKSRFIIPGVKGFSSEDANWISGGATSFVHVPYMLRLSQRSLPLPGVLLASITPRLPLATCADPLRCASSLAGGLADRLLAGFNRLMEQGVEPLARLIWAPQLQRHSPEGPPQRAPLREPVITADPLPVQARQHRDLATRQAESRPEPPAPELPEPHSPAGHKAADSPSGDPVPAGAPEPTEPTASPRSGRETGAGSPAPEAPQSGHEAGGSPAPAELPTAPQAPPAATPTPVPTAMPRRAPAMVGAPPPLPPLPPPPLTQTTAPPTATATRGEIGRAHV